MAMPWLPNVANHRLPEAAERGTSGAVFGRPHEFALLYANLYVF